MAASMRLARSLSSLGRLWIRLHRSLTFVGTPRVMPIREFSITHNHQNSNSSSSDDTKKEQQDKLSVLTKDELAILDSLTYLDEDANKRRIWDKNMMSVYTNKFKNIPSSELLDCLCLLLRLTGNRMVDLLPEERMIHTRSVWGLLRKQGPCPVNETVKTEIQCHSWRQHFRETSQLYGCLKPDVEKYNCLMTVFIENDHQFSPDLILSEMTKSGVSPNMTTYSTMIDAYCETGDIEGAGLVLKLMQKSGFQADRTVLLSFVKGYFRSNQTNKAMDVVSVLRNEDDDFRDPHLDALLMKLYLEKGDVKSMKKVRLEAEKAGVTFDSAEFISLIDAMRRFNQLKHIDVVIDETKHWLKTRSHDFIRLCSQFELSKRREEGLKIVNILRRDLIFAESRMLYLLLKIPVIENWPYKDLMSIVQKIHGVDDRLCTPVALFAAYRLKNLDYALGLLNYIEERGHTLKAHYFYPAICLYRDQNNREGMHRVLNEMLCKAHPTLRETVLAKLMALNKSLKHTVTIQQILEFEPSQDEAISKTECEIITCLAEGEFDRALLVFQKSGRWDLLPSRFLSLLLDYYIEEIDANWDAFGRFLQHAITEDRFQLIAMAMNVNEIYKKAPEWVKKILLTPFEQVIQTYSKESLQQVDQDTCEPSLKHLVQKHRFLHTQTVQEADEIIPGDQLVKFDASCTRHKTELFLKENKMAAAAFCFSYLIKHNKVPQKLMTQVTAIKCLLEDGYSKAVNSIRGTINKPNFPLSISLQNREVRQWVQSLCHKALPKDVMAVVMALRKKSPRSASFLMRDFLRGYITRGDVSLAMQAYTLVIQEQRRNTSGSHYLMDFLITNNHTQELRIAYSTCSDSVGTDAALASLYYGYVMNDFSSEGYEKISWDSANLSVQSLRPILKSLTEDLMPREAVDRMTMLTTNYLQNVSVKDGNVFIEHIIDCAVTEHEISQAIDVIQSTGVAVKEPWRTKLINLLQCRNTEIGLNLPVVFQGELTQLFDDTEDRFVYQDG